MAEKAKKPMSATVAAFLIKMAEDTQLQQAFADNPKLVADREGLSLQDANVVVDLGTAKLKISLTAAGNDALDQNQQMFIFEKRLK